MQWCTYILMLLHVWIDVMIWLLTEWELEGKGKVE